MQINVSVTDANNIVCEVVPPQQQIVVIDRGVEGNGIVSIVPVTISTFQYLRITYTNGTVQDVGPLTSTAYTATSPITIVGNTISLATVPIASGGTDATTAAGAIQNLLPSYTGNANKRLGLNSLGTALEWVLDGGGTVTSVAASGGTTGLTFTGSPITTSGTLTLGGTLAVANGGTGVTSSTGTGSVVLSTSPTLVTPVLGTPTSGNFSTGTFTWPTFNQNTSGTAAGLSATLAITSGGTGQITANAAFNALAPSQTGNAGKYLTTDGTDTSWATNPLGTVTSVAATVPSFLSVSGSPITTSGTLAFTLSGTALPTTSGGTGLTSFTANGVVYASSTSALTTGSALTFDGTKLSLPTTLAIKGAQNSNNAKIAMTRTDQSWSINNETDLRFYGQNTDTESPSSIAHSMGNTGTFVWNNANTATEQMRLTSTGLGIGTSSPAYKLEVQTSTTSAAIWAQTGGTTSGYTITDFRTGTNASAFATFGDTSSVWQGGGMTLNASGNLGLGVTPSAWGSGFPALQLGNYGAFIVGRNNTNQLFLGSNAYFNGTNWIYSNTAASSRYYQSAASHVWDIAPSGTAGNAITFTQAMTLDASGYLLVGATSSAGGGNKRLQVGSTGSSTTQILAQSATTSLSLYASSAAEFYAAYATGSAFILGNGPADASTFTERARINSSGLLGLGVSNPQTRLDISGALRFTPNPADTNYSADIFANYDSSHPFQINVKNNGTSQEFIGVYADSGGGNERVAFPAGNVLVGRTNSMNGVGSDGKIGLQLSGASGNFVVQNSGDDNIYLAKVSGYSNSTFIRFSVNGTGVGSVTTNGTNTTYATSSDYRLKNSIAPMTGALAKVALLKPCTYKWNADGSDGEGFIAHELQEVCPDAVVGEKDAVDTEGNPKYQGIDTSFLVATLTAAIQEQQAIIESLKARLDAANL